MSLVVVALGAGGVFLATRGGGEGEPTPATDPPANPPTTADAATTGEAPEPPGRVVMEVDQDWDEQDPTPHDFADITDEAWVDHPCRRFVSIALDTTVPEADKRALVEGIRANHMRNKTLDVLTWTYAACVAVERDSSETCRAISAVGKDEQECVDLYASVRLARDKGSNEACEAWFSKVASKPLRAEVRDSLCRAQHGEPAACEAFPMPLYVWACLAHLNADAKDCADIADVHSRDECLALVDVVRAARGLPAQTGEKLNPGMPMTLMYEKVANPELDCDAWFEGRMRETCY